MGSVAAIPLIADSTVFGPRYEKTVKDLRAVMNASKSASQGRTKIPVGPRCWAELVVNIASTDVRAVGVVQTGGSALSLSRSAAGRAGGCLGSSFAALAVIMVVVVLVGISNGWPQREVQVLLVSVAVCAGLAVLVFVATVRQERPAKAETRLVASKEPTFDLMLHGMNRLGQMICAIDDFDGKMRVSAAQAHLTPITLPESVRSAPEGIHVTLWEIAGQGEQLDNASLSAGIEALTKVVFDTIETTWATFEGFIVPIPAAPDELTIEPRPGPKPPAVDAVRLLKEITEQIEADRAAAEQTTKRSPGSTVPKPAWAPDRRVPANSLSRLPAADQVSLAKVRFGRRLPTPCRRPTSRYWP